MTKRLYYILFSALIASCNSAPPATTETAPVAETPIVITDEMIEQIIEHYRTQNPETEVEQIRDSSSVSLTFIDPEMKEMMADAISEYTIINYEIPVKPESAVVGDLNGDQKSDVVIGVTGMTPTANIEYGLFVFIRGEEGFRKPLFVDGSSISDCTGYFTPARIEQGVLIGGANCYAENDPRCCPSMSYEIKTKFETNTLVFVSKEARKEEQ